MSRLTARLPTATWYWRVARPGVLGCFVASGIPTNLGAATPASRLALSDLALAELAGLWGATLIAAVSLNLFGMLIRARIDGQPLAARYGKRVLFAMLPSLLSLLHISEPTRPY